MKKKGICGICPHKCPVLVTIEKERIVKVEADVEHPEGRVCPRGAMASDIIYSETRITKPLIRVGKKGEGLFRESSWEEALQLAGKSFLKIRDKYGANSLVSYVGSSGSEDATSRCFTGDKPFFKNIGSDNDMGCGAICNTSSNKLASILTYGVPATELCSDIPNSDIIFVWGKNPKTDAGSMRVMKEIIQAKKRKALIIVIDPRGEGIAELADIWIPIIPGSDGALAIAMLKIIVESGRYDKDFVENYTAGFEEFANYLRTVNLKKMSYDSGVSEETMHKISDIFCSTTKISLVSYTGLEYQLSGVQNNRAIQILWAITGKIDVPGGICFRGSDYTVFELKSANQAIGSSEFPLFSGITGKGQFTKVPNAVLYGTPYPVRGVLICGASPAIMYPNQQLWHEVYEKLECFVVLERYMSEDAKYADIILPSTTFYEYESIVNIRDGMRLRKQMIETLGEAKADVFILQGIAENMGFGDVYPKTKEELLLWMCKGDKELLENLIRNEYGVFEEKKITYYKYKTGKIRADRQPGFPTPSGKFEICSTYIQQYSYTPYPEYKDIRSIENLGSKDDYPLIMTTAARSGLRFCSFGPGIKKIAMKERVPTIDIGEKDAKKYGLKNGEEAIVETVFGKEEFKVRICPMAEGSIHVAGGTGSCYMEGEWRNHNINNVCSMNYSDPISGFLILKSIPCRVLAKTIYNNKNGEKHSPLF